MKSIKTITILPPQIERNIIIPDGEKKISQEGVTEIKDNLFEEMRKLLEEKGGLVGTFSKSSTSLSPISK